jgi:hypothetical protein
MTVHGAIFFAFLQVSLGADGYLLPSAIIHAGGVTTSQVGSTNGIAGLNGSGQVPAGQLGGGTASSSNFLRGDGTWAVPSSSGSTLASDTDVVITSPTSSQVLTYNSGSGKWINRAAPVTTVAGKTGDVTIAESDITNLTTDLSNKLTASNNLSDVSSAASTLSNLGAMPVTGGTFTGPVITATTALVDNTTISLNAAQGNIFTVTLTGNHTLNTPTNPTSHQIIMLEVTQDSTGSRTLAYSSGFVFSAGAPAPILSLAAGATDYLLFIFSSTANKWRFLDARLGY